MENGQSFLLLGDGIEIKAEYTGVRNYCLEIVDEDDLFLKDLGCLSFGQLVSRVEEGIYKLIRVLEE